MKKTRLLFFFLAAAALASCQKDPTEDTPVPVKAEFRGTAVFEAAGSSEEAFKVMWEPDVDRIGLFTVVDGRVEQTNIYYAAYSAVGGTTAFISPSPSKSIEWNTSVPACDVYAYYPYRVSYTDMTAIPVSVPSRQSGEAGGTAQIKKSFIIGKTKCGEIKNEKRQTRRKAWSKRNAINFSHARKKAPFER